MAAEGRRGRRDNGLDAAVFVPLADVDPRVGEHLLDVLGSAGVPAYLEPSVDVEPYTRAMSLPSPPTDRLWVDRDQRTQARQIVDAETPHGTRPLPTPRDDEPSRGLSDADEERAWQEIIAGFSAPPGRVERRLHYATEDPPPSPGPVRDPDDLVADPWTEAKERRRGRGGPADTDPLPTGKDLDRAAEERAKREEQDEVFVEGPPTLDDADDEHFEPPPPPPVPRPSRHTVLAGFLVVLGIALLAVPGVIGLDDRTGMLLGVVSILAGGVLLILRLRETRADDGPDDGAIV